ncbi:uncharacterized protein LOC109723858 isoform X2 [Ananas comosus]|uniref:Uncharacterized protein LOC109723858 isoform X2 n=1 Tax=Ananas comosus TaxID=4615 RepID=A0A6P5GR58_ANACO|nr:uncharacterized protein LOC109723858 isoform X2 [Ananas comosus]
MLSVGRSDDGRERIGRGFGMEENELEEGEACDDSLIDPDVALSYIDEKLQDVLGHFQKDFEGGFSAENLGSKFGGYGSFLPAYQRSPSVFCQPKSPPKATNHSGSRSPYNTQSEGIRQNSSVLTCSSITKNNISASTVPSADTSSKREVCLGIHNERDSVPQYDSLTRHANGGDQKSLKVRIKVPPDDTVTRNNAAIYSGLGLDISPSSSLEDSPDDSAELSPEFQDMPYESPHTIIQIMTCFLVPGGYLLSPLHDNVLQLTERTRPIFKKCKTSMISKDISEKCEASSNLSLPVRDVKGHTIKRTKPDDKKIRSSGVKSSKCINDISAALNRDIDIETPAGQELVSDALNIPLLSGSRTIDRKDGHLAEESANGFAIMFDCPRGTNNFPATDRTRTPEFVKGKVELMEGMECSGIGNLGHEEIHLKGKIQTRTVNAEKTFEEQTMSSRKDSSVDLQRDRKEKVKKNVDTVKADSDGYKRNKDQTVGPVDNVRNISSHKASSYEPEKVVQGKYRLPEDKGKQQGIQPNTAPSLESTKDGIGVQPSPAVKERKKGSLARQNLYDKKPKPKVFKSHGDVLGNAVVNEGVLLDTQLKEKLKSVKPENEDESIRLMEASKEGPNNRKVDQHSISGTYVNEPLSVPSTSNAAETAEAPAKPAPVVIEEHWVCCDICQQWRLLPYGTNPDSLPKKWHCSLLNWLPGMNSCAISEKETTKALNDLYTVPAPQIGISSDGRHAPSSFTTSSALHLNQRLGDNIVTVSGKKKNGCKDGTNIANFSDIAQISNSERKNQQASAKSRSLTDVNGYPLDTNSLSKADLEHGNKLTGYKKEKLKAGHKNLGRYSDGGDSMEKGEKYSSSKSKRMVDQIDSKASKKIKIEDANYLVKDWNSEYEAAGKTSADMTNVSSAKAVTKTLDKYNDVPSGKEKLDSKGNISVLSKRIKGEDQAFSNGEIKDFKTSDLQRSDKMELSTKKRKMKEWQESQHILTAEMRSHQLIDGRAVTKDTLREGEASKEKKPKVVKTEEKFSYGQASTAATSSSSKVSGSQKSKTKFQDIRGSPVESVSSSPVRINTEKLHNIRNSVGRAEMFNVGSSTLGSPKRCSDSEVEGGSNHSGKARKEAASLNQLPPLASQRAGESGTLDIFRGPSDYHDKETNELPDAGAPDEKVLHRNRNVLDQNGRYNKESPDRNHSHYFDKLNNHQHVDTLSHRKSGRSSSSHSKEKHGSYKSDVDSDKAKVSRPFNENKDSLVAKKGDARHIDQDLLGKRDRTVKSTGLTKKDNHSRSGNLESTDASGPCAHLDQQKEFDSRGSIVEAKCVQFNVTEDLKQMSSSRAKKSSIRLPTNNNDRSDLAPATDKLQPTRDKQEAHKLGPQIVSSPVKESRLEVYSTEASNSDVSKMIKRKQDIPNGVQQNSLRQSTPYSLDTSSSLRKEGHSAASTVLKEARDLKHRANRLKSEGLELESTGLYFEAALKFLHVASLWEPLSFDGSKQADAAQSIQMYSDTAKLCEFCAREYERCKEMAAAALAYKCVEVAYLKSAYYKHSSANKDGQELQTALLMIPPGESPSSSASDVDNLNNQGTLGKAASAKGVNSPLVTANHVIAARNHPHLMRLLTYTHDLNSAFEATRKSQIAIAAAAGASLEKHGAHGIDSVRRVLDFNFHNVKGLLRLVRLSKESISR